MCENEQEKLTSEVYSYVYGKDHQKYRHKFIKPQLIDLDNNNCT